MVVVSPARLAPSDWHQLYSHMDRRIARIILYNSVRRSKLKGEIDKYQLRYEEQYRDDRIESSVSLRDERVIHGTRMFSSNKSLGSPRRSHARVSRKNGGNEWKGLFRSMKSYRTL